jgi:hypothetical protein
MKNKQKLTEAQLPEMSKGKFALPESYKRLYEKKNNFPALS